MASSAHEAPSATGSLQTFATLSAGYNDPYFGLQRGFAQIDAGDAQQWSRGDGVRVAVIDTGVDSAHPDLHGRIETRRNFVHEDAGIVSLRNFADSA